MTPATTARSRARRLGPFAILAVLVLLAGGWPLIDSLLSDAQRLRAGTVLRIGPGDDDRAWFRVGPGWSLAKADTAPSQHFALDRGGLDLSVTYIALPRTDDADKLWTGLRETVRVVDPDAALGPPRAISAEHGAPGSVGTLVQNGDTGEAVIYRGPHDRFAIRMVVLAPRAAPADDRLAAQAVVRSLTFTEGAA